MRCCFACFLAFFPAFSAFYGQNVPDSLPPLRPERLLEADILGRPELLKKKDVVTATRTAIDIDEQPFTMFVVTAEEIARNNFVTLCDVLRSAPGIRVSQPGSALEGETFLMRGLRGNGYAKILINGVPIKPSAASGLPIGAQLPIRQAERIEILYGPAAAIWGGDACAGVINIILKETERPLFNQADLSFGRYGFNSLDLFFGGKLGRDRNIFRFSIYGSSTVQDDRGLFGGDVEQFEMTNYQFSPYDDRMWKTARNYRPLNQSRTDPGAAPQLSNTPAENRLFGLNLTWRGLHFTYHRMLRRDHSSLGLNPMAVAYANPQSLVGERIETFSLGAKRLKQRGGIDYNLSTVVYRLDNRSNFSFVRPALNEAFLRARGWPDTLTTDGGDVFLVQENLERRFFDNERYARAGSTDFRQEIRFVRRFRGGWQADLGNVSAFQFASPLTLFLPAPSEGGDETAGPIRSLRAGSASSNFYGQLVWHRKGFFGLVGGSANFEPMGKNYGSRAAFRFKINSWIAARAVFAEGYRSSSSFFRANSFFLDPVGLRADVRTQHFAIEKTRSSEIGGRFLLGGEGRRAEVSFFANSSENLLTNGHFSLEKDDFGIEKAYLGWRGLGFLRSKGLHISYENKLATEDSALDFDLWKGKKLTKFIFEHRLDWTLTEADFEENGRLGSVGGAPGLPKIVGAWRWSFRLNSWEISNRINWQSAAPTAEGWWRDRWERAENVDMTPRFTTVDLLGRWFLSKNFKVYGEFLNLFDRRFFGLDATGGPDDLLRNPQTGRQFRLGIHYDMN